MTQIDTLATALGAGYDVEREIGRGGTATVYLARDRAFGRRVAVKVLHPELTASVGGERFLREIRVAATLQHPHVLGLYESGAAGALLYYVMPFVDGESLRERLRRDGALPVHEALRIAAEVASALAYAHGRGIVHRDVKPENILLAGDRAVVADFGIARAVAGAADRITETGMTVGTPAYMSPEQALGGDVSAASDVYSLGCVLYEALVGEPPFAGATPMAIIASHAMDDVPSVRRRRPEVGRDVDRLVARALAKNPAERWPGAEALEREARGALARR